MSNIRSCSVCKDAAGMEILYSFGDIPVAGYLDDTREAALAAPLFDSAVARCTECGLVQQAYDHARDILDRKVYARYQPTYGSYFSYLERFLIGAIDAAPVGKDFGILEIGSNDGSGLKWLAERGYKAAGRTRH